MKKIVIILVSILFIACNQEAQSQDSVSIVVDKKEFKAKLATSKDHYLLDVRTKEEFDRGSIQGSINYDFLNGTFQEQIKSLDKSKPVFVYCASGGRSGKARKLLASEGFQIVYDLKGGYSNWSDK